MSRRVRMVSIAAASLVAVVLLLALGAVLALRSDWFSEKIRQRIVAEVEKATGGRAQIRAFRFDWKKLRAEVDGFVLHGSEPANAPPLFRADSIALGLKLISALRREVDIQYLDVRHPQVYLIVDAAGHTNVPALKVQRRHKGTVESILDLAIGRFHLENGAFEVQDRGSTPFDATGHNLRAELTFDRSGPRYRGRISISPADFQWGSRHPLPLDVSLTAGLEKNHVEIESARVASAQSQVEFSGAIDSLADLSGSFQYKGRVSLAELGQIIPLGLELTGPVTLAGNLRFHGASDYLATGSFRGVGVFFKPDPHFLLRNTTVDGSVRADPRGVDVKGVRLAGSAMATLTGTGLDHPLEQFPVSGRIETVVLRGRTLDISGIDLETLSGSFAGQTQFANLSRVHVTGDVSGFDVREMLRVYNGQTVPWDGAATGPVDLTVTLKHPDTLRVAAHVAIAPAGSGAPVHGSVDARYDGLAQTLDLGHSVLALPATRLDFSGVLGRQLRVHADSRNIDDVLPAFNVPSLPVKLRNGEAVFDGSITGAFDDPRIAGRASATNVVWSRENFDALSGDIDLTSAGIAVRNGSIHRGTLRAQGAGSLGMRDWSVEDSSPLTLSASIHGAPAADLLAIANVHDIPLQGSIDAAGKISGTFGDPRIEAAITASNGAIAGEPFSRFTGAVSYAGPTIELSNAQLVAGSKQITLKANYQHPPGVLDNGRLSVQVDSNPMPLAQFQIVSKEYPGIHGTAEVHANGVMDIVPSKPGFHIVSVNGALNGRGLRINDQAVRDVNLTAATKGTQLVAHLDSELAGSVIHGEGEWKLLDDYPGTLEVSFNRVDLTRLLAWLGRSKPPGGIAIAGSAEGTLSVAGPALSPSLWKAALRIPSLEIGPGGALAANGNPLALHNPEPIVISMERDVVKVESARLTGRATDLSLTGTVNLQQKNPVDLRVNGSFDLATLQDFNHDIYSAGSTEIGVSIRGSLSQPQVNGRVEIKEATFNLADIPVGIYRTNGVILFDGDRATIQSFSGESGGGQVTISGFAGYGGDALIFHLHLGAQAVRVRYPEDFSTVANASLNLTGSTDSSMLSGNIAILRTGFNPRSDFSSILAKSAEPVRTPSAQTGLLANMHFDVQIESAPDITFQSSLAQGLQAEASLRLRGTGSNPALLGRINITRGQLVFFGTQFDVNQGSLAFYNPLKIDPVLNIDLETKSRGVDVILNISGPINKLNLTPRSDPPLQFSDILALLATGRSPTADYSTLMASPASPQSLQSLGASALLGQAIASPVTGRLQRFFGVTRLKIDPTLTSLTGVENNPQARLTIEQQVTPNITFTYITDVTSSDPLVVQVEWAFSRNWSAVALREENGLFGLNFLYKRRF